MAINLGSSAYSMDQPTRDKINWTAIQSQMGSRGTIQSPQDKELQQRRGQLDQSYANARALLQPMAAGQNNPFSPQVVQGLRAGASDNAAGQARAARAVIDRVYGRQGLAGSGGAMRAKLDAQRQIGKGLRQEQTAIGTRAALGNADYQRSAIRDLMGLLGMETGYQGQFSNTTQAPPTLDSILGMGGGGAGTPFMGLGGGGGRVDLGMGGGGGDWYQQWLRDQQATEDQAAAIRAANDQAAMAARNNPFNSGLLGLASGGAKAGGLGAITGGVGDALASVLGSLGGGSASITGNRGSYSGSPEDVLSQIRRDRAEPSAYTAPNRGVPVPGGRYWSNAGPGWGMVTKARS